MRLEKTFPTTSRHRGNEKTLETSSFSSVGPYYGRQRKKEREKEREEKTRPKKERIKITKEARTSRPRSLDIADTTRTSKEKKKLEAGDLYRP